MGVDRIFALVSAFRECLPTEKSMRAIAAKCCRQQLAVVFVSENLTIHPSGADECGLDKGIENSGVAFS